MDTQSDCSNAASTGQKSKSRVTNWAEYDRALVQRGNLTVWFDEEFVRHHWRPAPSGKKGAPMKYSDRAIQVLLMIKATFHLLYRTLEGFARSLMKLMALDFDVPDHSHLARRAKYLQIKIPCRERTGPMHFPTGGFSPLEGRCPWCKPPAFSRFLFSRRFSPPIVNPPALAGGC